MKHFERTLEEIQEISKKITDLDARIEKENEAWESNFSGLIAKEKYEKRKDEEIKKSLERFAENIGKLKNTKIDCNLSLKIAKNNARIALYNDVINNVVDVFNKYIGKPYGEKTKEKIKEEIKSLTGCAVYITSTYRPYISVIKLNEQGYSIDYNLEIYPKKYDMPFLDNNKICKFSVDDLYISNGNYIDDIDMEVKKIRELHTEIKKKEEELRKLCSEYNSHTVEGIPECYINSKIATF